MSAEQRRITLTETGDQWKARIEPDGLTGSGETADAAVTALANAHTDTDADVGTNERVERALGALIDARFGETVERTFDALDDADSRKTTDEDEVDPDAPLFADEPIMSVEMGDDSIDDVLYGPVGADDRGTESPNGA